MSFLLGTNEALIIEDRPDSDGELELSMAVMASDANSESVSTWLNEKDAIKLVKHLKHVFEI